MRGAYSYFTARLVTVSCYVIPTDGILVRSRDRLGVYLVEEVGINGGFFRLGYEKAPFLIYPIMSKYPVFFSRNRQRLIHS